MDVFPGIFSPHERFADEDGPDALGLVRLDGVRGADTRRRDEDHLRAALPFLLPHTSSQLRTPTARPLMATKTTTITSLLPSPLKRDPPNEPVLCPSLNAFYGFAGELLALFPYKTGRSDTSTRRQPYMPRPVDVVDLRECRPGEMSWMTPFATSTRSRSTLVTSWNTLSSARPVHFHRGR